MLTLEQVRERLAEAIPLGVREYYFTGGEPFMNPEILPMLEETLRQGPASVLTNGLLLSQNGCRKLKRLSDESEYSLDIRISIDGYTAEANDPIRGAGTFEKILLGIPNLAARREAGRPDPVFWSGAAASPCRVPGSKCCRSFGSERRSSGCALTNPGS